MRQRMWIMVLNSTPDNGGFSMPRVRCFSSLLAFGRSFVDGVGSFVSRPFDIVIVGRKVAVSALCDVTFEHCKQNLFSHSASKSHILLHCVVFP